MYVNGKCKTISHECAQDFLFCPHFSALAIFVVPPEGLLANVYVHMELSGVSNGYQDNFRSLTVFAKLITLGQQSMSVELYCPYSFQPSGMGQQKPRFPFAAQAVFSSHSR